MVDFKKIAEKVVKEAKSSDLDIHIYITRGSLNIEANISYDDAKQVTGEIGRLITHSIDYADKDEKQDAKLAEKDVKKLLNEANKELQSECKSFIVTIKEFHADLLDKIKKLPYQEQP